MNINTLCSIKKKKKNHVNAYKQLQHIQATSNKTQSENDPLHA
jgi:hypothetical protein